MMIKLIVDQMRELRNHEVQWSQSCKPIIFIAYSITNVSHNCQPQQTTDCIVSHTSFKRCSFSRTMFLVRDTEGYIKLNIKTRGNRNCSAKRNLSSLYGGKLNARAWIIYDGGEWDLRKSLNFDIDLVKPIFHGKVEVECNRFGELMLHIEKAFIMIVGRTPL